MTPLHCIVLQTATWGTTRLHTSSLPWKHIFSSYILHAFRPLSRKYIYLIGPLTLEQVLAMDFSSHFQPDAAPYSLTQPGLSHAGHQQPPVHHTYMPYSFGDISTFGHEAHHQVGKAADLRFHMQQPFGLSTGPLSEAQHNPRSNGNGQGAFVDVSGSASAPTIPFTTPANASSPMGPPTQSRKRKAPTLREDDWEPCKARILDLHTTQKLSLSKVKQIIEDEYGFIAELRQYRSRIHQWGGDKNVKTHEMQAIVRKRQKRTLVEKGKGQLVFNVRGNLVEPNKIERWMKRNGVVESALYAPSPGAPTPSDVGCHTISERGSPAMVSVYSPVAEVPSPGGVYLMTQSPQMPSPALSTVSTVSSIFPLQNSIFAGNSPALAHRPLAQPHFAFSPTSINMRNQLEIAMDARPRYKADEEERLRDQIAQAELSLESNAEERLRMLLNLVDVLIWQGRYRAAEEVLRRLVWSYEDQSKTDEDDDEDKLRVLSYLGELFEYQGLYKKAERLHRRVLRGRQSLLGSEHRDTLSSVTNLGFVLLRQGRYKEAEVTHRKALERLEKILGIEHPDTLTSISYLGGALERQGKYSEAEAMHRRVVEVSEKVLGAEHPDTLTSVSDLGSALERQGKYKEAEAMHQQSLEGCEKVLGVEHPDTLTSVYHLAFLLHRQQLYNDSLLLYERAYKGRVKVLGAQHPGTVACLEHYMSARKQEKV
ncbi:hypothetical protein DE146DRAFT_647548 [Phaeosphaeria sp. MPI-PUGE-AT-0046c]|nr:hypothetical protein DE146DRAFT_647548 [Phaeosphaeria sp. MPI-PUGE-AT-0046c]